MIVLFSRDPGGANQMVAVYRLISGQWRDPAIECAPGVAAFLERIGAAGNATVIAKDFAVDIWRRSGAAFTDWADLGRDDEAVTRTLMEDGAVSALVTGTSDVDDDTDALLWREAAARGIPCHVFVDQNSHVARRFAAARPGQVYLPSESARAALLQAGWDAAKLNVIPDLHLADQARRVGADAADARRRQRRTWGIGPDRRVVLFASENVEELAALGKASPYSEIECLERLLGAIAEKRALGDLALTGDEFVVIRPHPKDRDGKYDALAAPRGNVIVSNTEPTEAAILGADIVVGMRSNLLAEAAALGRAVVSLAGTRKPDA